MNDLDKVTSRKTMTSIEMAKAFEMLHKDVMRRLKKLIESEEIDERTCTPVEYVDEKGEIRPMFQIDMRAAMQFALTSRKENAPELFMQLMLSTMNIPQENNQIESLTGKVEKLQKELKDRPVKTIGMSSGQNRKELHEMREELHDKGVCDKVVKVVKHYFYPVNEYGLAEGYRNKPGKSETTIDLNWLQIEPE